MLNSDGTFLTANSRSVMLTYYDNRTGRRRIKRRFVWAASTFTLGLFCGVMLSHLI